jgi:uncharacterized protein involved in outer membrane biogenesis
MKWKWVLGVAVGILFIVLVTLYVILLNFDFNYFKPQIAQAVREATGRKLSMEGNIELAVGLTPSLVMKEVGFMNASWGSRSEMARIKRFEIQVSLLPLIRKIIEIERLVLIEPDILIETDNAGNSNLRFDTTSPNKPPESEERAPPSSKSFASDLIFKEVRIKNGRLAFKDGTSGQTYDLTINRAKAVTGTDGPVSLEIKGLYHRRVFQIKGVLGPLAHLFDPDNPWSLKLTADTDELSVSVDGDIKDPLNGKGLNIAVTAKGESLFTADLFNLSTLPDVGPFSLVARLSDPNGRLALKDLDFNLGSDELARARITGGINNLLAMQGMDLGISIQGNDLVKLKKVIGRLVPLQGPFLPDAGPFILSAKLSDPNGRLALKDLDFNLGSDELARARITGGINNLLAMQDMDLGFSIQGNDLVKLEKVIGKPLPLTEPFDISGHAIIPSLTYYKINNLKASSGKSDVSGSLDLDVSREKPEIKGELSSRLLDLDQLLPEKEKASEGPKKASVESAKLKKKVFSRKPFPIKGLKQANVDIKIRAAQIILPSLILNDLATDIFLEDGRLTLKPLTFVLGGGALDGSFELHPQGETTAMAMRFKIVQSDLGNILEKSAYKDFLEGKIDMDVDLKSLGQSVAELMANLNGQTTLFRGKGKINNKFINLLGSDLSSDLLKLLNPFKKKTEFTEVNCLVNGLNISDGLAETSVLMLDTSQVTVVGYGKINLDTEKLDLALKSSPKKGLGVNGLAKLSLSFGELTKPFKLSGTLANPSMTIDPKGTLFTIGKAALASGKLGGENPCAAAIEAVKEINKSP